jgi:hypothetical protein
MLRNVRLAVPCLLASALIGGMAASAQAVVGVTVYVAYADNLRPNPFFPNPWNGSPNTIFLGSTVPGTIFDSGAIMLQNTTGAPVTVNDVFVAGFNNGATFDLWGTPGVLPNNAFMILTQTGTNDSQFDTSDMLNGFTYPDLNSGFTPSNPFTGDPTVRVTIDGVPTTLADTGHILDTGGFDTATFGTDGSNFPFDAANFPLNESLQWRPIGTTGIENPGGDPPPTGGGNGAVPEPVTAGLSAMALAALGGRVWRRR